MKISIAYPMERAIFGALLTILVLLQFFCHAHAADGWRTSASTDYSTGEYRSDESTEIWSLAFKLRYKKDRWRFSARLPYLWITGPGNVIGADADPTGAASATSKTERGLGDLTLSTTYRALYDRDARAGLSLRGKLKLPTADEDKRLGTGETDVYFELKPFMLRGSFTGFATLGYKIYGDTRDTNYRNVWYGTLGGQWRHDKTLSYGAMLSGREKVTRTSDNRRTLLAFATKSLSSDTKLQAYVLKGYGEASPDWGAGLMLQHEY